jgi:hypothetical protein
VDAGLIRFVLSGFAGIVICLSAQALLFAQRETASTRRSSVSVPFVGCQGYSQAARVDAPTGKSVSVPVNKDSARRLAFYKTELRVSVLAPRDWHCLVANGSDGDTLWVSPEPIDTAKPLPDQPVFTGPIVEIQYFDSGASGRFEIAEIIARVFPAFKAFAAQMNEGFDRTFPSGPYPEDRLNYKDKTMVEYETPAHTDGLGTYRLVKRNANPIDGVAILVGQTRGLVLLSVRLPGDQAKLTPEIVRQVERAYAK